MIGISLLFIACFMGCGGGDPPSDFEGGFEVVRWWTSPFARTRSAFSYSYPEQKPSQLIAYVFSPLGASEWPPMEGSGEFSPEEESMIRGSGQPLIPAGLAFVSDGPDPDKQRQIVLRADDAQNMIIAEAYADPVKPPVERREYRLK